MKILVVFTGGTIGSSIKEGYISPNNGTDKYVLIDMFKSISNNLEYDVEFKFLSPFCILSENLNGNNIASLTGCIKDVLNHKTDFDGIIITHGTDTLQYTAAALGLCFGNSEIPIVLVSSNYILTDKRANGLANFFYAVKFICEKKSIDKDSSFSPSEGVYVIYKNDIDYNTENTHTKDINKNSIDIHYATRLLPYTPYTDFIFSTKNAIYGRYVYHDGLSDQYHMNFEFGKGASYESLCESSCGSSCENSNSNLHEPYRSCNATMSNSLNVQNVLLNATTRLQSQSNVLFLETYPGQIFPEISPNVRSILIDSYHSGTLATENKDFQAFIDAANKKNIPVFVTGVEERTLYESSRKFKELKLNVLPSASPIAMYIKLWLLNSSEDIDNDTLISYMMTNTGNEFIF